MVDGSVRQVGNDVSFTLIKNDVRVPVQHKGDPPELFRPGIPVVLEGRFLRRSDGTWRWLRPARMLTWH